MISRTTPRRKIAFCGSQQLWSTLRENLCFQIPILREHTADCRSECTFGGPPVVTLVSVFPPATKHIPIIVKHAIENFLSKFKSILIAVHFAECLCRSSSFLSCHSMAVGRPDHTHCAKLRSGQDTWNGLIRFEEVESAA